MLAHLRHWATHISSDEGKFPLTLSCTTGAGSHRSGRSWSTRTSAHNGRQVCGHVPRKASPRPQSALQPGSGMGACKSRCGRDSTSAMEHGGCGFGIQIAERCGAAQRGQLWAVCEGWNCVGPPPVECRPPDTQGSRWLSRFWPGSHCRRPRR